MKKIILMIVIIASTIQLIAQPTQCVADALQTIEDQGGLLVGTSYEWIANGDDEIELTAGTDGILNAELYINNILDTDGFEFLSLGDIIRLDAVSIGMDDAASFAGSLSYSCPDWGGVTTDDLAVVSTLPVIWSVQTVAEIKNSNSTITFSTAQQINNSHFEIEHSRDGRKYQSIGKIEGEGNTNKEIDYQFLHDSPSFGINYYRVKQVDLDGQFSFSNVASVDYKSEQTIIYPNPAIDQLNIVSPYEGYLIIYDYLGVKIGEMMLFEGQNKLDVKQFQTGIYLLKFPDGSVERILKK